MEQLTLTEEQLVSIGFSKLVVNYTDVYEEEKTNEVFEIKCINSRFYYNPKEPVYKWYYQTFVGEPSNGVHLDITQLGALYSIFQAFKVKFNLVIY